MNAGGLLLRKRGMDAPLSKSEEDSGKAEGRASAPQHVGQYKYVKTDGVENEKAK